MSGHSKWASIKHKKAAVDARRGKLFTRVIREIMVAAKMGGGDIESNSRLRTAVQNAKDANMPKDNIDKAIRKGTGELAGVSFEDFTFEGFGRGGVAILVEGATDNRNRTTAEVRHIFDKYGGNLGENGCVSRIFPRTGVIRIPAEGLDEDTVMECALDAGAEDMETEEGTIHIKTTPEDLAAVRAALEAKGIKIDSGRLERIPVTTVKAEGKSAENLLKLVSALEDQDDVSEVAANFDIAPELIEQFS